MPSVKFMKTVSAPANNIKRDKKKTQYKKNIRSVSAPTSMTPGLTDTHVKVKGKVTDDGVTINGEVVGKNTLNRRLNGIADYDVTYKVLLLGDTGVGKTALKGNLEGRPFSPKFITTVGVDFINKIVEVDGVRVQLQIWDTAGEERFRTMTKLQYRGAKGVLLLYDVTNKASFQMLDYWLESIDQDLDGSNTEPVPVFILGNKADLASDRVLDTAQGEKVCARHYCRGFFETSAKDGDNVLDAFTQLAQSMLEIYNPNLMDTFLSPSDLKEKYDRLSQTQVCNGMCACGGIPPTRGRFKLKPEKTKPKPFWKQCFSPQ